MLQYPPNSYPPNSYPPNAYQQNTYQQQDIHQQQNVSQQQNTYTTQQNTITTSTITTNANTHVPKEMGTCCCCFPLNIGVAFICVLELVVGMILGWVGFKEGVMLFTLNGVFGIFTFIFGFIATSGEKKSRMYQFAIFYVIKTIWVSLCILYFVAGIVGFQGDNGSIPDVKIHGDGMARGIILMLCAIILLVWYFTVVIMKFYNHLYKH